MRKPNFVQKVYSYLLAAQNWYLDTPQRSLDEAYKAALLIKAIEDEHFNGKKITPESASYGASTMAYFQAELKKQLKNIRMRLTEFKASRSVFRDPNQQITKLSRNDGTIPVKDSFAIQLRNEQSLVIEKLRFIDEILAKYAAENAAFTLRSPNEQPPTEITTVSSKKISKPQQQPTVNKQSRQPEPKKGTSKAEETNILPRSILSTLNRLKVELDPKAEEEVVKNFRGSQRRTLISVRLVILFVLVPFLTFQVSRNLVIGPIVDQMRPAEENLVFLNYEMEERALIEMQRFEEKLKFESFYK